jgi:hypothetical protein
MTPAGRPTLIGLICRRGRLGRKRVFVLDDFRPEQRNQFVWPRKRYLHVRRNRAQPAMEEGGILVVQQNRQDKSYRQAQMPEEYWDRLTVD